MIQLLPDMNISFPCQQTQEQPNDGLGDSINDARYAEPSAARLQAHRFAAAIIL